MRIEFLTLIFVTFIISSAYSQKNSFEICALSAERTRCFGKYGYQCGSAHCANGKSSCENFLNTISMFRSNSKHKTYRSQMRNYDAYMSSIKKCHETNYALVNIINRIFHI